MFFFIIMVFEIGQHINLWKGFKHSSLEYEGYCGHLCTWAIRAVWTNMMVWVQAVSFYLYSQTLTVNMEVNKEQLHKTDQNTCQLLGFVYKPFWKQKRK